MIAELRALLAVFARGADRPLRGWLALVAVTVAADLSLIYALMLALRHRRVGAPYLGELLLYLVALAIWYGANRRLRAQTHAAFSRGVDRLSGRLVEQLGRRALDRFEVLGRAEVMMRLTQDSQRVAGADIHVLAVTHGLIRLALGALFVLAVAPHMAAPTALAMVVLAGGASVQSRAAREGLARVAADEVGLYAALRARIDGVIPIKQHAGRAAALGAEFDALSTRMGGVRAAIFAGLASRAAGANALLYGIIGLNVLVLPVFIALDTESIRDVNLVLVRIVFSVVGLAFSAPALGAACDALDRLGALGEPDDAGRSPPDAAVDRSLEWSAFDTVELRGVTYTYPPRDGGAGLLLWSDRPHPAPGRGRVHRRGERRRQVDAVQAPHRPVPPCRGGDPGRRHPHRTRRPGGVAGPDQPHLHPASPLRAGVR